MSVVAEKQTRPFNPTLGLSREDFSKNRELATGFYQKEGICDERANAHQGHTGQVSRLLVWATQRSAPVPRNDVSAVAVSHGPAARSITGHDTSNTEENHRGDRDMTTSPTNRRRFLSIEETAEYTGLSVNTLYKMVSQRRIPFVKMGRPPSGLGKEVPNDVRAIVSYGAI